jgi:hypothetical protein
MSLLRCHVAPTGPSRARAGADGGADGLLEIQPTCKPCLPGFVGRAARPSLWGIDIGVLRSQAIKPPGRRRPDPAEWSRASRETTRLLGRSFSLTYPGIKSCSGVSCK